MKICDICILQKEKIILDNRIMESKKMWIVAGVVGMFVAAFIVWGSTSPDKSTQGGSPDYIVDGADIIYYFGAECPHCQDVKKVIREKSLHDAVLFSEKEVWHNNKNADEMQAKIKVCGLDEKEVGVPFLYSRGKCYIGTPDVTRELENQVEYEPNS